ncbi:hypothetical protein KY285_016515 [Solanum tuberosum]|nr:hypothetical protein KY284_016518 [Solanum tuberosum]KAH0702237.1 hypothetical protein KY285_016515 [Solanum tuberosum]
MDVRRQPVKPLYTSKHASAGEPLKQEVSSPKASDALPLPLYLTTGLFFTMFFSVMYFLLVRWREKIRNSIPLHVSFVSRSNNDSWDIEDENAEQLIIEEDSCRGPCVAATTLGCVVPPPPVQKIAPNGEACANNYAHIIER